MNDIYLLYSCDEWKSNASMKLCTATNHIGRFLEALREELIAGNMEVDTYDFSFEGMYTSSEIKSRLNKFNSILRYGFIDIVKNGEIL